MGADRVVKLIAVSFDMGALFVVTTMVYATAAMQMFGGLIPVSTDDDPEFTAFNFNTYFSSWLTLFEFLITNYAAEFEDELALAIKGQTLEKVPSLPFIFVNSFWLFGACISFNIFTAF